MFALLIVINGIMGILSYVNIQNLQTPNGRFHKEKCAGATNGESTCL